MICEFLGTGADNGLKLPVIVAITRMQPRVIRRHIQQERHSGIPICADNQHGYYLAATEAERERCVKSMQHRAREIAATAEAISKAEILNPEEQS